MSREVVSRLVFLLFLSRLSHRTYPTVTWKETLALALKLGFLAAAGYAIASALLTLYGY